MPTIYTKDLKQAFARIIAELEARSIEQVEISTDWYRTIPADQWTNFINPEIVTGSLEDDVMEVTKMIKDPDRICTFVDFDRVAAMLNAISQELNPPYEK